MSKTVKNVVVLTVITVIAGALLGYVYDLTKEPIATQQEEAKQEAYALVFPTAASFEADDSIDISNEASVLEKSGYTADSVTEVLKAVDGNGNYLGYVFSVTSKEGYGGDISISVGIDSERTVLGVEILDINETAGLGMKAKEPAFKEQFKGKNVASFAYNKNGASADYEIDAISGATITTNAMTNAVNSALCYFDSIGGGN